MKVLLITFQNGIFLICMFLITSCYSENTRKDITLVGCTPGDKPIKSLLSISPDINVDFIRWDLKLNNNNTFVLNIIYGESQPNTLGFKDGGKKQSFKGTYSISITPQNRFKESYQLLKSDDLTKNISLIKINENVFHILTSQNRLMSGNGGWSYSLNRKVPINTDKILISSPSVDLITPELVFEGRTPCQEFATEYPEMNASQSCFKLKWLLTLKRDKTCIIRNIVDNEPRDIAGKWEVVNGTKMNSDAIIYKISVHNLADPILLLVGDDNVLFFLDKNRSLFTGNKDFSFVLNRKN